MSIYFTGNREQEQRITKGCIFIVQGQDSQLHLQAEAI